MLFAQVNQWGVTPEQAGSVLFCIASLAAVIALVLMIANQWKQFSKKEETPDPEKEFVTRGEVQAELKELEKKFEHMATRFDTVNTRFDAVTQSVHQMALKVERMLTFHEINARDAKKPGVPS